MYSTEEVLADLSRHTPSRRADGALGCAAWSRARVARRTLKVQYRARWHFAATFVSMDVFGGIKEARPIMRKLLTLVTLGMFVVSGATFAGQAKKREKRQQQRINQGVKSEELTKKETLKLEKKEAKLHRQIKKDRKDGGGLTAKERVKIDKKQDKLSKQIYKQKHDDQKQKS